LSLDNAIIPILKINVQNSLFNVKGPVDIAKAKIRNSSQQLDISLGQVTKIGEIFQLAEPRFSDEIAKQGMWRPLDFLIDGNAGLYFLEPYSDEKIPVLFVHGIDGTPRNFAYLTEHKDRKHFQPWLYYYPSGDGHAAAKSSTEHLPSPVYSWIDIAPGSSFLTELFYTSEKSHTDILTTPEMLKTVNGLLESLR
jgi:hypothetical protein